MKIVAKSFAKVNPYLKITGVKEDGYHQLKVGFLSVNLADNLSFQPEQSGKIKLTSNANIAKEDNLCYKAARDLKKLCSPNTGAKINLEKNIPIGGGLGGGSSNAATTLICLNRLWNCGLTRRELIKIGKKFGADIPFFFYGGFCSGIDTGAEVQQRYNVFQDRLIPIISPPFPQLTSEVYEKYDQLSKKRGEGKENTAPSTVVSGGRVSRIENDLQEPTLHLNPKLVDYLDLLKKTRSISHYGIAGSGSSVFGITRTNTSARNLKGQLRERLRAISQTATLNIARPTNNAQFIKEVT